MKQLVWPIFTAAELYVQGGTDPHDQYAQLYSFLMERFEYSLETSITPSYSLLCHGVGDSRAFATVYAAMCRRAGLEFMTITGTRSGDPWTWNIILDNGTYFHVDLLRSNAGGQFWELTDLEMRNYVWDYSAYPACAGPEEEEPSEPLETAVEKS